MTTSLEVLGRAIKQVQWRHHRALDSRMRLHQTSLVQWDAMRAIKREPGATARRLAAETFQSEQAFGAMAAGMEANGIITRHHGVGRRLEHHLTPEGERLLSVGHGITREVFSKSLGNLTGEERRELHRLLQRVLDNPALDS